MNKDRFYQSIIVILIILLGLFFYTTLTRSDARRRPMGPKPGEVISKRLNFDQEQIKSYHKLIVEHRKDIMALDESIRTKKNALYQQLKSDVVVVNVDSLSSDIADLQKEIEQVHFLHFEEIKNLCKDHQIEEFDDLVQDLSKLFSPRPMKRR